MASPVWSDSEWIAQRSEGGGGRGGGGGGGGGGQHIHLNARMSAVFELR
jgi:hypothetical protein